LIGIGHTQGKLIAFLCSAVREADRVREKKRNEVYEYRRKGGVIHSENEDKTGLINVMVLSFF
jgi:hypothetical protein